MPLTKDRLRALRVAGKQLLGIEPRVRVGADRALEFHGSAAGGWCIVRDSLGAGAVVVDVGLGEDVAFAESIIRTYGCAVEGFDPTPRAIRYVRDRAVPGLRLHEFGLGATSGRAEFYLPNNAEHVSGSVTPERHLGRDRIEVELRSVGDVFDTLGADRIDLLKLDIEGTEYDVIAGEDFARRAPSIGQLCVEFHHRWDGRGKRSTDDAVARLGALGFVCVWSSPTTNEEFTFVRVDAVGAW